MLICIPIELVSKFPKLFFPTGDPLMLGIADAIGGAQVPYSMAIALKQTL